MSELVHKEQRISEIKLFLESNQTWNEERRLLYQELRSLQREASLLKKEETAIPIKNTFPQDSGAPCPFVVSSGFNTGLLFYIGTSWKDWDITAHDIHMLNNQSEDYIALVEFKGCYSYKFGGCNDEVLHGHPLYEHGLEAYDMHEIKNSKWIKEQEKINSVHPCFEQSEWNLRKHYIFTFHDDIFECIADDYTVQIYQGGIKDVLKIANENLFARYS